MYFNVAFKSHLQSKMCGTLLELHIVVIRLTVTV